LWKKQPVRTFLSTKHWVIFAEKAEFAAVDFVFGGRSSNQGAVTTTVRTQARFRIPPDSRIILEEVLNLEPDFDVLEEAAKSEGRHRDRTHVEELSKHP
jgi:urease accessory protein UreH